MVVREKVVVAMSDIMLETEEACAIRMMNSYGVSRGMAIAELQRRANTGPIRGYYWRVKVYMTEFEARGRYETVDLGTTEGAAPGGTATRKAPRAKPSRRAKAGS